DVLPAVVLFALGLSATVAPLTATVLSAVDQRHAGIASAVNNAVARIAGLVAIAVVGAVLSAGFATALDHHLGKTALAQARKRPLVTQPPSAVARGQRAQTRATLAHAGVAAFHDAITVSAALVAAGGLIAAAGVQNPRRRRA